MGRATDQTAWDSRRANRGELGERRVWGVLLGLRLSCDRRGDRRPLGAELHLSMRRVPAP